MWPSIIEGLGFSSAGDALSCPRFLAGELAEACTVMRRSEPVQPDSGWADVADITIATEQPHSFWALEPFLREFASNAAGGPIATRGAWTLRRAGADMKITGLTRPPARRAHHRVGTTAPDMDRIANSQCGFTSDGYPKDLRR